MKVYDEGKNVVISIPKTEIRFATVYGDHEGFYLRFQKMLPVESVVALETALPQRCRNEKW